MADPSHLHVFPWWWRVDPPLEFIASELGEAEKTQLALIQLEVNKAILQTQVAGIDRAMQVLAKTAGASIK